MYKYLILGFFTSFLLFRNIMPIIWCINYLYKNEFSDDYLEVLVFHMLYLIVQAILIVLLINYIYQNVGAYKDRISLSAPQIIKTGYDRYGYLSILVIIAYLVLNYNHIPLLMNMGSDSIVSLVEEEKFSTWLTYGILQIATVSLSIVITKCSKKNKVLFIIFLIISVVALGKKSALINLLFTVLLIFYISGNGRLKLKLSKFTIMLIASFGFILFQYSRTLGGGALGVNILNFPKILLKLIYDQSTSYLVQLFPLGGLNYSTTYSDSLGNYGGLVYFFNSYTKLLFGFGIEKSIGPYLSYVLFGNNFPNGVNPTLFFEFYFVFDNLFISSLSIIILVLTFVVMKKLVRKTLSSSIEGKFLLNVSLFSFLFACLPVTLDSLNTIRNIPFYILPLSLYYLIKLIGKKDRTSLVEKEIV